MELPRVPTLFQELSVVLTVTALCRVLSSAWLLLDWYFAF